MRMLYYRLNEPRCIYENGFRAFEKSVLRLYNKLPDNVNNSENDKIFKKRLNTYLFREYYDLEDKIIKPDYKC